jgi:hypothetical protein
MSIQLCQRPLLALALVCALGACSSDGEERAKPADSRAQQAKPEPPAVPATPAAEPKIAPPQTNADAQLLKDFKDRIDAYMKLYERQEKGKAQPKETSDPGKIKATQDTLAARIQAARKDAKPGDIFTPEIKQLFRRLMFPEMKGPDASETKKTTRDEEGLPAKSQILKVNARYPENAPLPTVPPNLLSRLPQLPEELEYRFVNKDLILRDVNANLIIDFIPNAIQ